HRVRGVEIRIYRVDLRKRRRRCRTARDVAQVCVLKLRAGRVRRIAERREDQVSFDAIVVHAKATANRSLVVVKRRVRKTHTRHEVMMRLVKTTRSAGRHRSYVSTITTRNAPKFFRRHTIAGANESIETIAAFSRVDVSVCENRNSLRRIVESRIKVSEIVRLSVD